MTDQDSQTCNFKDPENVKDILELLDKLGSDSGRSISSPVLGILGEEAEKYFKDSDILSSLGTVFTRAKTIRGSIISDSRGYPKYSSLNDHDSHDCVPKALKTWLPKAYAALLFMLFNCDSGMTKYSLGEWSGQKVNGSGGSKKDLHNWLTKEKLGALPFTPGLIKRGFSTGELTSNTGETVADAIKNIITHDTPGSFQKVLASLLFACPWDNALLGHALCFVTKFCEKVGTEGERLKEKFKGYSEDLKTVCLEVGGSLTSFLNNSSQSHILAVSQGNSNVYSDVFKDDSLDDYCDWLKRNLKNIIDALKAMSTDCKNWGSPHSFEWGYTAGPFLYGFVPKTTGWMNHIKENLPKAITPLIESLNELKKALEPSSSTAAAAAGAAGGIFGLGGAGAGAAYATNAFGLKDIITGLISRFLS
ncbi:hypothetical protein X943_003558 [Babesia divergens]|uniref:Uncharacterized protein n=1 Tax=Babesia divergens TaxID=32595 RepID=A0AAD9GDJ1_BABDI|nr:hypothetical protein X943_003558 [Babesia divergens]